VDGGGIRGIIPATFLVEFEKRTGKATCELFDLIAGTSTGGLLAAGLTLPDENGRPKYTAQQMLDAYFDDGGSIFHKSLLRRIVTAGRTHRSEVFGALSGENLGVLSRRYTAARGAH
jgi:patatin-like phospholipase/acyl hydrolase